MRQAPTPGPWEVEVFGDYQGHYKLKTPLRNWATGSTTGDILDEERANAQLMEAAPAMYEACKAALADLPLLDRHPDPARYSKLMNILQDAVAKAEGREALDSRD